MKHDFHSKKELALFWASLSDSLRGHRAGWRRPRVVTHRQTVAEGAKWDAAKPGRRREPVSLAGCAHFDRWAAAPAKIPRRTRRLRRRCSAYITRWRRRLDERRRIRPRRVSRVSRVRVTFLLLLPVAPTCLPLLPLKNSTKFYQTLNQPVINP